MVQHNKMVSVKGLKNKKGNVYFCLNKPVSPLSI